MTDTSAGTLKVKLGALKHTLALFLALAFSLAPALPVGAQRGRAAKSFGPLLGGSVRVAESGAAARVAFTRVSRMSTAPAFSAAARTTLTREGVGSALLSAGIRRRSFNVAAGSVTRTPRVFNAASKLPALNSGSYAVGMTAAGMASSQSLRRAWDIRALMSPRLPPRARSILGSSFNEATSKAAAARALESQAGTLKKLFDRSARLHKNSRFYRAPSHAYVIVGPDGRLYKVGESSAGLLKNGLSKRAQTQVNSLNRKLAPGAAGYSSRVIKTFESKQAARDYERELIVRYKKKYAEPAVSASRQQRALQRA